jgi:3-dehydroquinate synthase
VKEVISNNYSIWIGTDSLSKLDVLEYSEVAILVDENTRKDCLNKLPKIPNSKVIEIKSGEKNKNISTCNLIWQELTNHNFSKNSLLINLGGGVIGDMGGFCAATYKRGIDFIQIPTTLLAMTDASIGGKLGVDLLALKNQIGLFTNPKSVLIYPDFLESLPLNQLKSGFAEVLKHALIANKNLWNEILNTSFEKLNWNEIILRSVEIKNKIVLSDPKEKGERRKLNFGHTYGHAIESFYLKKSTPILHGQAIALGMLIESKMSNLSESEKVEITAFILSNFTLPYNPAKNQLINFMRNDKKNLDEKINFTLLDGIGSCTINNFFSEDEL